jgi:hypothetical protein
VFGHINFFSLCIFVHVFDVIQNISNEMQVFIPFIFDYVFSMRDSSNLSRGRESEHLQTSHRSGTCRWSFLLRLNKRKDIWSNGSF